MRSTKSRFRAGVAAALVVLVATTGGLMTSAPAGATTTQNNNFTKRMYSDFLIRSPDEAELLWWDTYLASNSRTSMVSSIVDDSEFAYLWVASVQQYYLGASDDDSTAFMALYNSLDTSGNFVATEVSVLGGSEYFTAAGSTNTGFVTRLYQDVLQRNGGTSEISYWVGQLSAATKTRSQVAQNFIRSSEAAARRVAGPSSATSCATTVINDVASVAAGAYCLILDRIADSSGASYWTTELAGTAQMPALWSQLAGSTEYFNLAQP